MPLKKKKKPIQVKVNRKASVIDIKAHLWFEPMLSIFKTFLWLNLTKATKQTFHKT